MKDKKQFIMQDPFNSNLLEGLISSKKGAQYGELTINKVNGIKVNYAPILGTPKLAYPFTIGGNFQFPSASEILCYRKYDGSNVLAYRYWDAKGTPYISYKVRLWPFLRGKMVGMWKQMLTKYTGIPRLFALNPDISAFSFEMYGNQHTHLIAYENELDISLLFGLKRNGEIVINRDIKTDNVPKAELVTTVTGDYVWNYNQQRDTLETNLELVDDHEGVYSGEEGTVWYMHDKRTKQWRLFKCKPQIIEALHWGNAPLGIDVLNATALNILEVSDEITIEIFKEYLAEEYTDAQIRASMMQMKKVMIRLNSKK